MMGLAADMWHIEDGDEITFAVEVTLFLGFIIITILLGFLRKRYPQLTKNGWIELVIGSMFLSLKGLFDGLDTISASISELTHDIFDSFEAVFIFVGLILLGIGLLRIALYSAKVWEVR
ncbi:MAG: hypothetical protein JXA54_00170 [Candidatus Heimdallarchaeota archaeon]|nr:hypothetical protein [Candidatus Heimdallarchaeota archaeon]